MARVCPLPMARVCPRTVRMLGNHVTISEVSSLPMARVCPRTVRTAHSAPALLRRGMGKSSTKKPVIGDTPIKEPTGRMRPVGESVPIRPHEHALSTFAPRFLGEGPPQELEYRSDAYQEKLAVLEKRLKQTARKDETGSFVVLRSDVFKFCQQIAVPLDDVEINSHVKRLIPDASGRVRLTEVVMSLRNHGFKPSSRPKPSPEFVGI
eukprot:7376232-Prymnesium_polylepis.1